MGLCFSGLGLHQPDLYTQVYNTHLQVLPLLMLGSCINFILLAAFEAPLLGSRVWVQPMWYKICIRQTIFENYKYQVCWRLSKTSLSWFLDHQRLDFYPFYILLDYQISTINSKVLRMLPSLSVFGRKRYVLPITPLCSFPSQHLSNTLLQHCFSQDHTSSERGRSTRTQERGETVIPHEWKRRYSQLLQMDLWNDPSSHQGSQPLSCRHSEEVSITWLLN